MAKRKTFPRNAFGAKTPAPAKNPGRPSPDARPAGKGGDGEKKAGFWRTAAGSVLSFVLVIGGALAIKTYVADIYFIPSGSMEPTLHGRTDGGDRIACLKLPYYWRDPLRWEIGVFEFPVANAADRAAWREVPSGPGGPDGQRWRERRARAYQGLRGNLKQNYIKRFVGLPGETIRFARGDLWRESTTGGGGGGGGGNGRVTVERLVKPAAVQRDLWIGVYAADFARTPFTPLAAFWRPSTDGLAARVGQLLAQRDPEASPHPVIDPDDPAWAFWRRTDENNLLAVPPPGGVAYLDYDSRVPDGRGGMAARPGVVDRYVVRQPVRFFCDPERRHPAGAPAPEGRVGCGKRFTLTVRDQYVAGFCPNPRCGAFLMEDAVEFYHRRSSLPINGLFHYAGDQAWQREGAPRRADYHIIGDLRLRARLRFLVGHSGQGGQVESVPNGQPAPTIIDDGDAVPVALLVLSDGRNGCAARLSPGKPPELVFDNDGEDGAGAGRSMSPVSGGALPAMEAGRWYEVEVHRADGLARLYVDDVLLFEAAVAEPPGASAIDASVSSSGVRLGAFGGAVEWASAAIDRDIYYFSGAESGNGAGAGEYAETGRDGRIVLGEGEWLALGDNSASSYDSRGWGPVPESSLRGTALATWWPPHRAHGLNGGLGAAMAAEVEAEQ